VFRHSGGVGLGAVFALICMLLGGCGSDRTGPEAVPSVSGVWAGVAENFADLPEPSTSDIVLRLEDEGGVVSGTLDVAGTALDWYGHFDATSLRIVANHRVGEATFEWLGTLDPVAATMEGTYGPRFTESRWRVARTSSR